MAMNILKRAPRLSRGHRSLARAFTMLSLTAGWMAPTSIAMAQSNPACRSVTLEAKKEVPTGGPTVPLDGVRDFCPSFSFTVPSQLPVTSGTVGEAYFTATRPDSSTFICVYQASPASTTAVNFVSCTSGSGVNVGDNITVTNLKLRLSTGTAPSMRVPAKVELPLSENSPCRDVCSTCDDGNPCTHDIFTTSCQHPNEPAGRWCDTDGDLCDGVDTCDGAGVCQTGSSVVVDDGDSCTIDSCDPPTGIVTHAPAPSCAPDPVAQATPINPMVASSVGQSMSFLYQGSNPVQQGVSANVIDPRHAVWLRGRVIDRDGNPVTNVKVTVVDHPEYGHTWSRANGEYDLVVNGGGYRVLDMRRPGYLFVQRHAGGINGTVEGNLDYGASFDMGDAVMLARPTAVTSWALGTFSPAQTAQGALETDARGSRTTRVFLPAGTEGWLEDGSTQTPLTSLHLRIQERTVGPLGPQAMPGELPPHSAYTFAASLSVDEAEAAGAHHVGLSKKACVYVDNFLNFPVGGKVPVGFYESNQARWDADPDGRVMKVVSITSGKADIDVSGDGTADPGSYASFELSDEERTYLAQQFTVGQSFWRVQTSHFSEPDFNWPAAPELEPPPPGPQGMGAPEDLTCRPGSIIGCESQTLSEVVPVAGAPFSLMYHSDRTRGYAKHYSFSVPAIGWDMVPPTGLVQIELKWGIAGRELEKPGGYPIGGPIMATEINAWDGKDALGRLLQGAQRGWASVDYHYAVKNVEPSISSESFAKPADPSAISYSGTQTTRIVRRSHPIEMGWWISPVENLGGWELDIRHAYDPFNGHLYPGTGGRRSVTSLRPIVVREVGNGSQGLISSPAPAKESPLQSFPYAMTFSPDGELVFASQRILYRVDPQGIMHQIGGQISVVPQFDGMPALDANFVDIRGVVVRKVAGGEEIYISDWGASCIRKIDPSGFISTFAGHCLQNGGPGTLFDSPDPLLARFWGPRGLALDEASNLLFVADGGNHRIRRIDLANGHVTTLAGSGPTGIDVTYVDGLPWGTARIPTPRHLAIGKEGIYVSTDRHVLLLDSATGDVRAVAGNGAQVPVNQNLSDGANALDVPADAATGLAVGPDGFLYINLNHHRRIYRLEFGKLMPIVGGVGNCFNHVPGQSAFPYNCNDIGEIAFGPDGSLHFPRASTIASVKSPMPSFSLGSLAIPSEDGAEIYEFDPLGKHMKTLDARSNRARYEFIYDTNDLLTEVKDSEGQSTFIARAGSNITVTAPFSRVTTLTRDSNQYLASIEAPGGDTHSMTYYGTKGLLRTFTPPSNQQHNFTYNSLGLLLEDNDPAGGSKTLSRTEHDTSLVENGYTVAVTSGMGRQEKFKTLRHYGGKLDRITTYPDGTQVVKTENPDGSETQTFPDLSTITTSILADQQRFGMRAPLPQMTLFSPGGDGQSDLSVTVETNRQTVVPDPLQPWVASSVRDISTITTANTTRTYSTLFEKFSTSSKITRTDAANRTSYLFLDDQDRVVKVQPPGVPEINIHYDSFGRPDLITQGTIPNLRTAAFSYTAESWLETATNALNQDTIFGHDTSGRVNQVTRPDSAIIGASYYPGGNLSTLTPPSQPAHSFAHTPVDLLDTYTPPAVSGAGATSYVYNDDRQLDRINMPGGRYIDPIYDPVKGRVTFVKTSQDSTAFIYDNGSPGIQATGKLIALARDDNNSLLEAAMTFDYAGSMLRRVNAISPAAGSVEWLYNSNGWPESERVSGTTPGTLISTTYDPTGLPLTIGPMTLDRQSATGWVSNITTGSLTEPIAYSVFGEADKHTVKHGSTTLYEIEILERDKTGRIIRKQETLAGTTGPVIKYGYHAAGWLEDVWENNVLVRHYDHDPNGNRTAGPTLAPSAEVGTYDAQDRQLTYGGASFTYTPNGERFTKLVAGQTTTYTHDDRGSLRQVSLPGGTTITYDTDTSGRRAVRKVNGSITHQWLYRDGLRIAAELDASGAIVSRFIYAGGHVPALMEKGGVTYRLVTDQVGSVRAVVDVATGTVAQTMAYDEYGNLVADTNPGFQPFGFAGGQWDAGTGLVRFGVRDYEPVTGRWTRKDPYRFGGGSNFYIYSNTDPVNWIDPDGMVPLWVPLVFGAGIVLGFGMNAPSDTASAPADIVGLIALLPFLKTASLPWMAGRAAASSYRVAGASVRHGGQMLKGGAGSCGEYASKVARAEGLAADRLVTSGPGVFNPLAGKGASVDHFATRLADGRIVDRTILDNIRTYGGSLPESVLKYTSYDTFDLAVYEEILQHLIAVAPK